MANPQKENGYTGIANEILEAMMKRNFTAYQWRVLLVIFRNTYGWDKKTDAISYSQFQERTGIKKTGHIYRALKDLQDMNVITAKSNGTPTKMYSFQKDYCLWLSSIKDTPVEDTPHNDYPPKGNEDTPVEENEDTPVEENTTKELQNTYTNICSNGENIMIKGDSKEILDEIRKLPDWKTRSDDGDWVNEIMREYPVVSISAIRKCRDWHLAKHPNMKKRNWKLALRNWMEIEEKANGQSSNQNRQHIEGNRARGTAAAIMQVSEIYNGKPC